MVNVSYLHHADYTVTWWFLNADPSCDLAYFFLVELCYSVCDLFKGVISTPPRGTTQPLHPGDRGYSLLTGLVLPTIAMLQGFYNLLLESKAAALQPDQNRRWYNVLSRFKAYLLNAPDPHSTQQDAQILLFLGLLLGGYPATIARGDLDPGWFLLDAHIIPQTFFLHSHN